MGNDDRCGHPDERFGHDCDGSQGRRHRQNPDDRNHLFDHHWVRRHGRGRGRPTLHRAARKWRPVLSAFCRIDPCWTHRSGAVARDASRNTLAARCHSGRQLGCTGRHHAVQRTVARDHRAFHLHDLPWASVFLCRISEMEPVAGLGCCGDGKRLRLYGGRCRPRLAAASSCASANL